MAEAIRHRITYELDRVPEPLAENLDNAVAKAALRKYETKRTPNGLLHSAWNFAEYGINLRLASKSVRDEYFYTTQLLTGMVISHPEAHQDDMLNALTLASYIPLFNKRAGEQEVTPEDCDDIYQSLGMAMSHLRPLDIEEPPQWRMTEISVLSLSARARQPQLLLYPTSPREEASNIQALNHDSYFVDENVKLPLQQKLLPTQKTYDGSVRILTLQPILERALRKSGIEVSQTLAEKVNYLLGLIVAETLGHMLDKAELTFLNTMTEAVVGHYFSEPLMKGEAA